MENEIITTPEAVEAQAPEQVEAPQNIQDAMFPERDEKGRFVPKQAEEQPPVTDQEIKPEAKPEVKAEPEDITAMPEGLGAKAQERFQKLASGIKERDEQIRELSGAVSYVQETFQQHGIKQEQFESAVVVLGALNRQDYDGAAQMLLGQLRQLSLMTGKDYGADADPLTEFPELAQRVQGLQISRDDAVHMARLQRQQQTLQQRQQMEYETQQSRQQEEQTFRQAQASVDQWARKMAASDIDWPVIEAKIIPALPRLLQGTAPTQWANVVQTHYDLLKTSLQDFRRPTADANPLRPTGTASAQRAPQSMHEAMFGPSQGA